MEDILRQTLLFDFYGELLTQHQQKIYEAVICNDMGYSEVASEEGISRQGVHDLVKRCTRQLDEYEQKLHLVERFLLIRNEVDKIRSEIRTSEKENRSLDQQKILSITDHILEEL